MIYLAVCTRILVTRFDCRSTKTPTTDDEPLLVVRILATAGEKSLKASSRPLTKYLVEVSTERNSERHVSQAVNDTVPVGL